MLLHFSGLLSLCFADGIDFLVKGCISTIMIRLHLYAFEGGDLVALCSSLVSGSQTFSSGLSSDKVTKVSPAFLFDFLSSVHMFMFRSSNFTCKTKKRKKNV